MNDGVVLLVGFPTQVQCDEQVNMVRHHNESIDGGLGIADVELCDLPGEHFTCGRGEEVGPCY